MDRSEPSEIINGTYSDQQKTNKVSYTYRHGEHYHSSRVANIIVTLKGEECSNSIA